MLFDEAGELERQGQWGAAQEKLRAALRIKETPHLRYALGWALENDDKLLEARVEYETAARLAQQRSADEVSRLTAARLSELATKTPVVQVRVPRALAGSTKVIVDGRVAPIQNDVASIPVNPGSRVVRIERPNKPPSEQLLYVSRGSVRTIDLDDDSAVASRTGTQPRHMSTRTTVAKRDPKSSSSVLPWALVGGGAALVVGGGALLVSSASDANARDENQRAWCAATACSDGITATRPETAEAASYRREAVDASDRGNLKQAFGVTIGLAGLVTAGIGTYMLVRESKDARPRDALQKVRVSASPTLNGAFANAAIQF